MYELNERELDSVSGGLVNVVAVDVVDIENNNVAVGVPVNASVAVGILGAAASGALQRPGRIIQ